MRRPLLALLALLAIAAPRAFAAPGIGSVVNTKVKDYRATATLSDADLDALRKIGKDYADSYRFKTMQAYLKEPGKIRFEMKALMLTFTYVINGNTKYTSVPTLHIQNTKDITTAPQTRQTSLELGFITKSSLADFNSKFVRMDGKRQVFELRFKRKDQAGKKIVLWVDPEKKILTRRDLYNSDGKLKARFDYSSPRQVATGIWMPTRITVHNAAGQFGGATTYAGIRVNTGIPDKLFQGI